MKDFFCLAEKNTNVKTEVLAGFTTFFTMAYIIFVNPNMLAETGMSWPLLEHSSWHSLQMFRMQ